LEPFFDLEGGGRRDIDDLVNCDAVVFVGMAFDGELGVMAIWLVVVLAYIDDFDFWRSAALAVKSFHIFGILVELGCCGFAISGFRRVGC